LKHFYTSFFVKHIFAVLDRRDKIFFIYLFGLSTAISLIEFIGVSAIIPFVGMITDNAVIKNNKYINFFYNLFNFSSMPQFIVAFGLFLVAYFFFRGFFNLYYYYMIARFSYGRYHKFSNKLFNKILYSPYKKFQHQDSSSIYRSIINETLNASQLLVSLLNILAESMVVIFLYLLLLYVNIKATISITIIFVALFITVFLFISKKMRTVSHERSMSLKETYEILTNFFHNFKFIKLISCENFLQKNFNNNINKIAKAYIKSYSLHNFPRLFLETIGFGIIIIFFLYVLFYNKANISYAITFISIYILALYRMLPSFNRILSNYNSILFNYKSIEIIHNELNSPTDTCGNKPIFLNKYIKTENLTFYYHEKPYILDNVNITINKSEKIGIIGKSGAGKSTFLDLLMAFLTPVKGRILIDNIELMNDYIKSWRNLIGYIPQNFFLFNDTIEQNIVFGRDMDNERLLKVIRQAHIEHLIDKNNQLNKRIGEGGSLLSGGEKQRIALARALYGNPDIIIMDEATNSLDFEVENEIMNDLFKECSDKTIIIVSHRLNTVERCDKIYLLADGKLLHYNDDQL
jgi:ABC-type bacteriocin/lantibiotic exporter with double-glycine peptidase domain